MSVWTKIAKAATLMEAGGLPHLMGETKNFLKGKVVPPPPPPPPPKSRQLIDYAYVRRFAEQAAGPKPEFRRDYDEKRLVINWLIPTFEIGSGGHTTIFRMIQNLEKLGHQCNIYILFGNPEVHDAEAIRRTINEHFLPVQAQVYLDMENMVDSDVVMATSWPTVYPLLKIHNTLRKCYFVQDFEPWFYPKGSEWYFAESTYRKGFYHLTAGPWLTEKLRTEYSAEADFFHLSWDRARYRKLDVARPNAKFRVLFYARPVTPRRCFELGMLALESFYKAHPDQVEIVTLGWDISNYELPFPVTDLGVVAQDQLAEVYSGMDLALVHSSTNCSLLPLELMACQVPVIDLAVDNVRGTLVQGENAYLAEPTPEAIAQALEHLHAHPAERQALAQRGYAYALNHATWEDGAQAVEAGILKQLAALKARA